jgi:uncharacterized membrane protein YfcA
VDATPLRDVLTVVAGVGTGVLSGAFGVGGATISTPAIRALGASATLAIGTTLPSILPSAVTGTIHYAREKLILWRVVALTTPAGVIGSVGGSLLSKVVPGHGHYLQLLTATLLGFTAWRMSRTPRPADAEAASIAVADDCPAAPASTEVPALTLAGIGLAAGVLSGLLGVGGGIIMVPAFLDLAHIPVKPAVATSLACVGIFAIPGTITHSFVGDIDWRFAAGLSVGVIPGARLGAAAAIRATDRRLRLSVAWFLGVIAVIYATGEILALR